MTPRPFALRKSAIAGRGAFATRKIPKGACIIEYRGERIGQDEADRRYPEEDGKPHHTFLFTLNDEYVIDANHSGGTARWINHSCDPNCEAVIEDERIYLEAIRDIAVGEELN